MRCYICETETAANALAPLDEEEFDRVTEYHMLVACQGTDDQFDAEGFVVVCDSCAALALNKNS